MAAAQLTIMLLEGLVVGGLIMVLFRLRTWLGLSLLCVALGVLQPLQVSLATMLYSEIIPGILLSPGSVILFVAGLFAVLLVYIREDAIAVRKIIYGLLIANVTVSALSILFDLHLALPGTVGAGATGAGLYGLSPRIMLAGTAALVVDVLLIVAIYERLGRILRFSLFLRSYVALALVLVVDSVLFATGGFLGTAMFSPVLVAGLVGKPLFAILFAALLTLYIRYVEPEHEMDWTRPESPLRDVFYALSYREKYEIQKSLTAGALRRADHRRQAILDATMDSIIAVDANGIVLEANPAGDRAFGYPSGQLTGRPVTDLIESDALRDTLTVVRHGGTPALNSINVPIEVFGRRANGSEFPAEVAITQTELDGKVGYILSLRDISTRKRLEEERLQASKMESIGHLAAGIAHDFNNLLAVILGSSEMLRQTGRREKVDAKHIAMIYEAARRAAKLTGQLLSFARKQVLSPEVVDVDQMITSLAQMLDPLLGKSVELRTEMSHDLHPVLVSYDLIEQVIVNLAANARDAMPDGGVFTIATSNRKLRGDDKLPDGDYVVIGCRDTGGGIPADVLGQIFDPYFTTKEVGKGTGLGLAMCYGIVDQSQGKISVQSDERGTLFEVFLPRTWQVRERAATPIQIRAGVAGEGLILAVDDDPQVLELTAALLRSGGYRVLAANGGESALGVFAANASSIDLVLTDVMMPDMRGDELVRRIDEHWPGMRVLFMTAFTDREIDARSVGVPVHSVLTKPFTRVQLFEKVRLALAAETTPDDGQARDQAS